MPCYLCQGSRNFFLYLQVSSEADKAPFSQTRRFQSKRRREAVLPGLLSQGNLCWGHVIEREMDSWSPVYVLFCKKGCFASLDTRPMAPISAKQFQISSFISHEGLGHQPL